MPGVRLLSLAILVLEMIAMEKRKAILIAVLVLQIAFLFVVNRFFVSDMREDIDEMRQELISKGMPSEQVNTIAYTLSKVKTNVSGYVLMTAVFLVALNGSLVQLGYRKEGQ